MTSLFGVYCTDGITKSGESFSISALEDLIWQGGDGRPLCLSHDFHRCIGWNVPIGLYISHEMSYVVGNTFIPDNKDEQKRVLALYKNFFSNHMTKARAPYWEDFINLLNKNKLINDEATWLYNGVLIYGHNGILTKAFPFLKNIMDPDGLILLDDLCKHFHYLGQGIFAHNKSDLAICLHPYFRRSYSRYNNFNCGFINLLFRVYKHGCKGIKILLDPDYIGFAPSFKKRLEFEYWYGPKYTDDIAAIPPGLTHYENDENNKIYNNVKSTEFVWQKKDNGMTYQFEMEEIVDSTLPALPKDTYGCRYLHALYDLEKGIFNHFDGAIRGYNNELMLERIKTPLNKMGHQATYKKIFRIDGSVPIGLWKSLVTQYLCSNKLVYDYFGIQYSALQNEQEKVNKNEQLQSYVPYPINKGDGIRLLISYIYANQNQTSGRKFLAIDETTLENNQKITIAEFATIEVYKALNRVGAHIKLPEGILYYKSYDFYNCIPCIHHAGDNLEQKLSDTLSGIRLLIDTHVYHNDNERYSISLSWPIENKYITISFIGHVTDLQTWLNSFDTIPVDRMGLKKWMEKQNTYIHSHGCDSSNPINSDHIKPDGILFFQRHDITEHVNIQSIEMVKNRYLHVDFSIENNNEYLYNLLKNKRITYTPKFIVFDAIDQNSGESYLKSHESAVFRETTYQLDCKMKGFNWAIEAKTVNQSPT